MSRQPDRPPLESAERWRAPQDLRIDIAYVVMAVAILAGISALDSDPKPNAAAPAAVSATR
jgi:hypothetical protein